MVSQTQPKLSSTNRMSIFGPSASEFIYRNRCCVLTFQLLTSKLRRDENKNNLKKRNTYCDWVVVSNSLFTLSYNPIQNVQTKTIA